MGSLSVGTRVRNKMGKRFQHPARPTLPFQKLFRVTVQSIGFMRPHTPTPPPHPSQKECIRCTQLRLSTTVKNRVHSFISASLVPLLRPTFLFVSWIRGTAVDSHLGPSEIEIRCHIPAEYFPLHSKTYTKTGQRRSTGDVLIDRTSSFQSVLLLRIRYITDSILGSDADYPDRFSHVFPYSSS
jgi:hypothetical protein